MKNFKDEYKKTLDGLNLPDLTPEQILLRAQQKKVTRIKRQKRLMVIATAACLFLLCSVGVGAAAGYARSLIRTTEYGFQTEDFLSAQADTAKDTAVGTQAEAKRGAAEDTAVTDEAECKEKEEACIVEEMPETEYDSYEAFSAAEDIPFAKPPVNLLCGKITEESYSVAGESFLFATIEAGEKSVRIDQSYFGDTQGHASSTVYSGGVCNERIYTASNGFDWTVIDSVCEQRKPDEIHAAISVGDYEVIVNFSGYSQEEAFDILDGMDLKIYLE